MPYNKDMRQHLSRSNEQRHDTDWHCQQGQQAVTLSVQLERGGTRRFPMPDDAGVLMTVEETAAYLRLAPWTIRHWGPKEDPLRQAWPERAVPS